MGNTSSIREQLTFKAGLQIFLVVASLLFTALYTLPTLETVGAQTEQTNAVIKKYEDIAANGISFSELESTAKSVGNNSKLIETLKKSPTDVANALKKEGNDPYFVWLTNAISNSSQYKNTLQNEKARINSIVPTLSPISEHIDEESITLRDYIFFIEQNILKKFEIESLSPLGIDGVVYKETEGKVDPIGNFGLDLSFKMSNYNIEKMLNYLHESGNPAILTDTGSMDLPKIMSNPLITIDSLSLSQSIDSRFPNMENSGRVNIKFFVRGSSQQDSDFLLESFNKKRDELSAKINDRITKCQQSANCAEMAELQAVESQFRNFNASFTKTMELKKGNPIETIYLISQQLQSLQSLQEAFENIK